LLGFGIASTVGSQSLKVKWPLILEFTYYQLCRMEAYLTSNFGGELDKGLAFVNLGFCLDVLII